MAAFAILFGTRHIDASEHHEGMVAAIAFESVVKLLAFLAVECSSPTASIRDSATCSRAPPDRPIWPSCSPSMPAPATRAGSRSPCSQCWRFCPAATVPGARGRERRRAPRQKGGLAVPALSPADQHLRAAHRLRRPAPLPAGRTGPADTFVLALPMAERQQTIALLAFIGGLSAATGMIIVETVALSTMVCNDLVMPTLLRVGRLHLSERRDLTASCWRFDAAPSWSSCCSDMPTCGSSARPTPRHHRARLVRSGRAVRARDRRRAFCGRSDQGGSAGRAHRRLPGLDYRCCCRPSPAPAGSERAS